MKTIDWRLDWEDASDLTPPERRILCAITLSMGTDGGQDKTCFPGAAILAKRTGYSARHAGRIISGLAGRWFDIEPRPGRSNIYIARTPEPTTSDVQGRNGYPRHQRHVPTTSDVRRDIEIPGKASPSRAGRPSEHGGPCRKHPDAYTNEIGRCMTCGDIAYERAGSSGLDYFYKTGRLPNEQ